ncbi:50S ribosomal protein L21e [Candidatus Woesearchaeota archaeon]|nr:50S ribosomal protein L21e [Candidatus Woesearchaeota archaeon]
MGKRKGGYRRGSRQSLRKHHRTQGKISLTRFLAQYKTGDRVSLSAESAYQKGMHHIRHNGRMGHVVAQRGRCYEVTIMDGNKEKLLIVHPIHLKRIA